MFLRKILSCGKQSLVEHRRIAQVLHTSLCSTSGGGFVVADIGDAVFEERLTRLLSKSHTRLKFEKEKDEIFVWLKHVLYHRDLRAILSGNVPEEMILQVRILPFVKLKKIIRSIKRENVTKEQLASIKSLVEDIFQDEFFEIIYCSISFHPFISNVDGGAKLLVVYRAEQDVDGLRLLWDKTIVPFFMKNYVKTMDVKVMKRSLTRRHWDEAKQWLLHDRWDVLVSENWQKLQHEVIDHLLNSQNLRESLVYELNRLSMASNLKGSVARRRPFEMCTLVCLNVARKLLPILCVDDHDGEIEASIQMVSNALRSNQWVDGEETVRRCLAYVSAELKPYVDRGVKETCQVDDTLQKWSQQFSFENNLTPKEFPIFRSDPAERKLLKIPESSITAQLMEYERKSLNNLQLERLSTFVNVLGEPVSRIDPNNILLISKFGSHLYNLATEFSDSDYHVVFCRPQNFPSDCSCSDKFELRSGNNKEAELLEARIFCQMMFRFRTQICELVLSEQESEQYVHPIFKLLMDNWMILRSERMFRAFLGYANDSLKRAQVNDHGAPITLKFLYQAFHKLLMARDLLNDCKPQVTLQGENRQFLLSVRRGTILRSQTVDGLYAEVEALMKQLTERKKGIWLPEYPDYRAIMAWLTLVRNSAS